MELLEQLGTSGEQVTFALLFVALLLYVIKTNDGRERRYLDTIDKLTESLKDVQSIKDTVEKINEKLRK